MSGALSGGGRGKKPTGLPEIGMENKKKISSRRTCRAGDDKSTMRRTAIECAVRSVPTMAAAGPVCVRRTHAHAHALVVPRGSSKSVKTARTRVRKKKKKNRE